MKGAREYVPFLKTGRYGQLEIVVGEHARGRTLHVYVHNKGDIFKVEVYGIISGQPGWTEEYGWLHEGPWHNDFNVLVSRGRQEAVEKEARDRAHTFTIAKNAAALTKEVLDDYKPGV